MVVYTVYRILISILICLRFFLLYIIVSGSVHSIRGVHIYIDMFAFLLIYILLSVAVYTVYRVFIYNDMFAFLLIDIIVSGSVHSISGIDCRLTQCNRFLTAQYTSSSLSTSKQIQRQR